MRISRRLLKVLLLVCLCSAWLASIARAAAPAAVTVRVEGVTHTLLAPTQITTDAAPVVKDGNEEHSCAGGSAAGALERATAGGWNGEWFEGFHGYSVETILGERLAFEFGAPENFFWAYWLDNKPSSVGICEGELSDGESILFFPECFSEQEPNPCPPSPNPLGIVAPAVIERGVPVTVSVTSYANANGAPSPAVGATVTGGGASAGTDAGGHATLTLTQTGNVQLQVTAPNSVRSEATVCVHDGNDGNCGTTSPSGSSSPPPPSTTATYKGPYAIVARATGVAEGRVYPRGRGPKLLSGTIATHAQVATVSLELRRSNHGHCFAYNGKTERFQRARCGHGELFSVGSSPSFSYLLPAALGPGRYVLDVQAIDVAGNRTSLARGSSRIVFYVR